MPRTAYFFPGRVLLPECAAWGPHMGTAHGDRTWGPHMGTAHGDRTWGPHMGTTHGDHTWGPHCHRSSQCFWFKSAAAMAPKGKAKAKAKAKPAPRIARVQSLPRNASPGLVALNAERRDAERARPGSFRECPSCGAARHVADAAPPQGQLRCPVRVVRTAGSDVVYDCGFKTQPHNWRLRPTVPADRADARARAVRDAVVHFETERVAGRITDVAFWARVREEAIRRVPLVDAAAAGAVPAAQPPPAAPVPGAL
jgi:hypothetical protein